MPQTLTLLDMGWETSMYRLKALFTAITEFANDDDVRSLAYIGEGLVECQLKAEEDYQKKERESRHQDEHEQPDA